MGTLVAGLSRVAIVLYCVAFVAIGAACMLMFAGGVLGTLGNVAGMLRLSAHVAILLYAGVVALVVATIVLTVHTLGDMLLEYVERHN